MTSFHRRRLILPALVLLGGACAGEPAGLPPEAVGEAQQALGLEPKFSLFESGQVRPLALSPDGGRLYAINTPDNRLEVFDVKASGVKWRASVTVGLEPVAVAARSESEVWVVNHLSDSVSVVDVSDPVKPRVVRTLLVGDEPRDVVFAAGKTRAFITTAHRGQNSPVDPGLKTPGIGRADVWVFDAGNLGASLGGAPLDIVTLFTDTPRALAVSPDGTKVYAAGFFSGNQTTAVSEVFVPNGGEDAGGMPKPNVNHDGEVQPENGLIVKFNGTHWVDRLGRNWDDKVQFNLPDKDVFVIDATANPPVEIGNYAHVGTTLFNMAVNPVSGKVYVANTDAQNDVRFEGPGQFAAQFASSPTSVRGHLVESRITVLANGTVSPRHLNKHIDYTSCCAPLPNAENQKSLAFPMGMAVSSDGATLYVAAFGSAKVGVYSTAQLENDTFVPSTASQIALSGGGPSGLVLDEAHGRLYVMTRFDNSLSVVETSSGEESAHIALYNPEPPSVVAGRPFLYDASYTSSHGDSACASCHVFGDFDGLSWDLGNPDDSSVAMRNPVISIPAFPFPTTDVFKTMKGPMNTQSLRGMANNGPMHWRGDRTGAAEGVINAQPDSGSFDEQAAFRAFNGAFEGLVGRSERLTSDEMQAFTDFALQIMYPPNPVHNLDNSLTPEQEDGKNHFFTPQTTFATFACNDCHKLDPDGNRAFGVQFPGFFGTNGMTAFDASDDPFDGGLTPLKVPHLRNLYQKVGFFGLPPVAIPGFPTIPSTGFMGDQVRGFAFSHDGSVPLTFFLGGPVFSNLISPNGFEAQLLPDFSFVPTENGQRTLDHLFAFLMAFPSNHAPIVGQQITLTATNAAVAGARITLLEARAAAGDCELVAKRRQGALEVGYLYSGGQFYRDKANAAPLSDAGLRALAQRADGEVTFTAVPLGSGRRIGIDADLDGYLDGDEMAQGTNPRDPSSHP